MTTVTQAELGAMLDEMTHCFRVAHNQTLRERSPDLDEAQANAATEEALTALLRQAGADTGALTVDQLWDLFLEMQKTAIVSRHDMDTYAANVQTMNQKLRELERRAHGC